MSNKIRRYICGGIVCFNLFLIIGFTGACEVGELELKSYILKCLVIGITTIIPALKSGLFD